MKKSLLFPVLALMVSCVPNGQGGGRQAIPYVENILSGTVPGIGLLRNASLTGRDGDIYLYGDSLSCASLCDSLMAMDSHDNASGAHSADFLADFCGETFVKVADSTARGAADFLSDSDTAGLRRLAVNMVLSSLDTCCFKSRYDYSGLGRKQCAKQLILCDPVFAVYGKYDVDTLLCASSCNVRVLVPAQCALEQLALVPEKSSRVGVMSCYASDQLSVYQDVYQEIFHMGAGDSADSTSFFCAPVSTLRDFLDVYSAEGNSEPLVALVLDCFSTDVSALRDEFARLNDVMCPDYSVYGRFFAPGFRIISVVESVIERSYRDIRERNLFTHNISLPSSRSYCYVGGVEDDSAIKIIECSR